MDKILQGIIDSQYPEVFKKQLVERILIPAASRNETTGRQESYDVLLLAWEMGVNGDTEFIQSIGQRVFSSWAIHHKESLAELITPTFAVQWLTDANTKNKARLLRLVTCALQCLKGHENFSPLCRIVQMRCISFVQESGDMAVVKALVALMKEFPECLPIGEFAANFCGVLVRCIASASTPSKPDGVRDFVMDISAICALLKCLWSGNEAASQATLHAVYTCMTSEDTQTPLNLAAVIETFPSDVVENATKALLMDSTTTDSSLILLVARMLDWISWPATSHIDVWILALLKGLAAVKKYSVLMSVFEGKIEQVFGKMFLPVTRKCALPVLSYMLLCYQHSPILFVKIAGQVPELIHKLRAENTDQSRECLEQLCPLLYTVMYLHAGFPDIYDPIVDALKGMEIPSVSHMQQLLAENRWGVAHQKYVSGTGFDQIYGYLGTVRSETGMTGLVNLGNTCYLNSVLQALYMTESFRTEVLQSTLAPGEVMLSHLQEVFAYLTLTQRPAFSPTTFVKTSKPPWFESGEQQDCAEFLRFLLDQINEQQKSTLPSNGASKASNVADRQGEHQASIAHKVFGGIMETSYVCLTCRNASVHRDTFTDLHLAFPENHCTMQVQKHNYWTRSVTRTRPGGARSGVEGCSAGSNPAEQTEPTSSEPPSTSSTSTQNPPAKPMNSGPLSVVDLLGMYFQTETMEGENQYFCEKCNCHQNAVRDVKIVRAPEHLILTLLRFSYNASVHTRTKILSEIAYPLMLTLPLGADQGDENATPPAIYSLYAVVVHSGVSAECGHYYCYARQSVPDVDMDQHVDAMKNGHDSPSDAADMLPDKWFLFNDTRVTFSSYASFQSLSQRFPKDTAYLLFYRNVSSVGKEKQHHTDARLLVNKHLREKVAKDNATYLQEQELMAGRERKTGRYWSSSSYRKDFDDSNPPSGSCGGGSGGGMDLEVTRFVY